MTKAIILLDDDPDEQFVLRDAFAALGVEVNLRQFYTAEKLVDYLDQPGNIPEILFLDVNLPGQTGIECLQMLHAEDKFSGILTVIYTNDADERTIAQSFEYGAAVYIKKMTFLQRLTEILNTILAWDIHTISSLPRHVRTFRN